MPESLVPGSDSQAGLARIQSAAESASRGRPPDSLHSAPPKGDPSGGGLWRCSAGDGARPDSEEAGAGDAKPAAGTARRVLVVDDERSIRLLCRVNLVASGIDVIEASDGREGLELARQERPDLVLLDVMMPELDGWTVARELAADEQTRDIPIVFLTARADPADRRLGRAARRRRLRRQAVRPGHDRRLRRGRARAHRARRARPAQARDHVRPRAVTTAERSEAADRARRLQRVAELLAEAVTPQEVLDSILTEGVRPPRPAPARSACSPRTAPASSCSPNAATTPRR